MRFAEVVRATLLAVMTATTMRDERERDRESPFMLYVPPLVG